MAQLLSPVCSETPLYFQASSSPSCCPRIQWRASPGTTRSGIDFRDRCRSRRRMGFRIAASVAGDSLSKQDFADDYYTVLGLVILNLSDWLAVLSLLVLLMLSISMNFMQFRRLCGKSYGNDILFIVSLVCVCLASSSLRPREIHLNSIIHLVIQWFAVIWGFECIIGYRGLFLVSIIRVECWLKL